MGKLLIAVLFLLTTFLAPLSSFAQTTEEESQATTPAFIKKTETMSVRKSALADFKDEIKTKRMEAIAEMKTAREEFRAALQTISDQRKKAIVERIDTRLTTANEKYTDKMADNLEKLSSILDRISSKAASLKTEGKDTTTLDAAIEAAQAKITSAKTAVSTQASKEYVITITDEATLGATISPIVTQFRTDIGQAHQSVIDAKEAVVLAAKEIKALVSVTPTTTL